KGVHSKNAGYGYTKFKADAEAWITRLYNGVQVGKKAIFVPGTNNRRSADILVCEQFRRYTAYDFGIHNYHEGVTFYSGGKRIENFPKQHSENCTGKHQATNGNFKPMVRVLKNMRNAMIENGLLADGVASSYFIEGMLSNVPNDRFTGDYGDMFVACFNWVVRADETKLTTASGLHRLVRGDTSGCWRSANFPAVTAPRRRRWQRETTFGAGPGPMVPNRPQLPPHLIWWGERPISAHLARRGGGWRALAAFASYQTARAMPIRLLGPPQRPAAHHHCLQHGNHASGFCRPRRPRPGPGRATRQASRALARR